MRQGADPVSLHWTPDAITFLVQQLSAPREEHPTPPHWPQSVGQHTPEASYPSRPFEHVCAVLVKKAKDVGQFDLFMQVNRRTQGGRKNRNGQANGSKIRQ